MSPRPGDWSSAEAAQDLLVTLAAAQGFASSVVRNASYSYTDSDCALKSERCKEGPSAPAIYKDHHVVMCATVQACIDAIVGLSGNAAVSFDEAAFFAGHTSGISAETFSERAECSPLLSTVGICILMWAACEISIDLLVAECQVDSDDGTAKTMFSLGIIERSAAYNDQSKKDGGLGNTDLFELELD